jgi:glutaminyl-tRNA synthetase
MYEYALQLIKNGNAYVCELSVQEIKDSRGTLKNPGIKSPYRDRPQNENIDLFERMKSGEFENASKTLRAKIDMSHPNMNMRDPVIYRILHANHHRTADEWCIYPMYDWAHGLEDSIEGVTHSLCSLEFEDHRPLYDWYLDKLGAYHPQQIEFARLNLSYTVMSKRKLKVLVENNHVSGWDDPRMPTISGFKRRGYTPKAIRNFMEDVGVAKRDNIMDIAKLESSLRSDLNKRSLRRMAVLNPLKVVITNYPDEKEEFVVAKNNPEDESAGTRKLPFSKVLYIEKDDFMENPPKKFFRLTIGAEVRFKYAYYITCNDAIKDDSGNIVELHCTYDKDTFGGRSADGRKVNGTVHWVSANHSVPADIRLYDRLFTSLNPDGDENYIDSINPDSLKVLKSCRLEPDLETFENKIPVQFERIGYFFKDCDSTNESLVFNRTVALRDTWAKK